MTTVPAPDTTHPTGGRTIDIAKGSHLALTGQQAGSPHEIFILALMASICRGGKPVRCSNFLRGVSLRLESVMPPVPGEKAEALFNFIYAGVEQPLKAWLRQEPAGEPFCREILGITARFAHNSHLEWLPGVMQIDAEEPCSIEEFVTSPPPDTAVAPAVSDRKPAASPATEARPQPRPDPVVPQRGMSPAVRWALECNLNAMSPECARIPFPVRFRASGALQSWAEVRRAAGAKGARLQAALADPRVGPYDRLHDCLDIVDTVIDPNKHKAEFRQLAATVSLSVPSQAFWLRKGALFEPTDALEQLLKLSDVGDDMPLAALARKARALCIVPGQGLRQQPDGVDSITPDHPRKRPTTDG